MQISCAEWIYLLLEELAKFMESCIYVQKELSFRIQTGLCVYEYPRVYTYEYIFFAK